MNYDLGRFSQELLEIQRRWKTICRTVEETPERPSYLLRECLEEMGIALEELHVAEEELATKNAEILQVNQALSQQMQRYQDLFESAPDGYLETDIYGQICEANLCAADLFGLETDRLRRLPIANLIAPEDRQTVRSRINQMPTLKRIQYWEIRCLRHPQRLHFDAMLTVETIRNRQGDPTALRWIVRDVTELKRSQAELQQTKLQNMELMESDRLKQQFLANVSHELRSPLNSIVGFSSLLQQQADQHPSPKCAEMIDRIYRNGQNLLLLIQELLDFSKLKGDRPTLRPETFDLCPLIHRTLEELGYLADQNGLTLETHLPPDFEIKSDSQRLRQILVNLVSNAIKFTEQGSVTVRVEPLNGDRVVLSVQDTGIGIAPEDQKHIFKEFWQVNQQTTSKTSGTGLGLAIVYEIVRTMGGTITLESAPNQGTTFRLDLPRWLEI